MKNKVEKTLAIIGVHSSNDGYPNVKYRILDLLNHYNGSALEKKYGVVERFYNNEVSFYQKAVSLLRLLYAHLRVFLDLITYRRARTVYIPYPAVLATASLSILPRFLRPRKVIIDAFISLYDTIVFDRKMLKKGSLPARLLYILELQAYRNATIVLTDTDANSRYYQDLFKLPAAKFKALPLHTCESAVVAHSSTDSRTAQDLFEVLFVGTLVPLHGVQHILNAMHYLQDKPVKLTILGDGQMGEILEEYLRKYPEKIEWIRDWQSIDKIHEIVSSADICLGIFGDGEKAKRVCPFKIYIYTHLGKPVISENSLWARDVPESSSAMMLTEGQQKDLEIANTIIRLIDNPKLRFQLEKRSKKFYDRFLSNSVASAELIGIIDEKIVCN